MGRVRCIDLPIGGDATERAHTDALLPYNPDTLGLRPWSGDRPVLEIAGNNEEYVRNPLYPIPPTGKHDIKDLHTLQPLLDQ